MCSFTFDPQIHCIVFNSVQGQLYLITLHILLCKFSGTFSVVLVEEMAYLRGVCLWKGQYFANNATWQHDCNTCSCVATAVSCTQVWCGLGNCLGHPNLTLGSTVCQSNQVSAGTVECAAPISVL